MNLAVPFQGIPAGKSFETVASAADKGPYSCMTPTVLVQGRRMGKGLGTAPIRPDSARLLTRAAVLAAAQGPVLVVATGYIRAGKGFLSGMDTLVPLQVGLLHEGLATAFEGTGKRPVSCMHTLVDCQGAAQGESFGTAFEGTGKRALVGMGALVCLQGIGLRKSASAAFMGTEKGLVPGMKPLVPCKVAPLAKGPLAAFIRADKGLVPGMRAQVSFQVLFFPECSAALAPGAVKAGGAVVVKLVLVECTLAWQSTQAAV